MARTEINKKPSPAKTVSVLEKSPRLKKFESLATISPPLFSPIKPTNKPTPEPIATLRFMGMLSNIHLLSGVTLIITNKMPAKKTAPKATSQEYPISITTVNVKKAFRPIPGAKPTGQLAYKPIAKQAKAAAIQVPTKLAPGSIPAADMI